MNRNNAFLALIVTMLLVGGAQATTLCTAFASPTTDGGTYMSSGFVCNAGDLTISNLSWVWHITPGAQANPGEITIDVDASTPDQVNLLITAANSGLGTTGWNVSGGGDDFADFTLTYTVQRTNSSSLYISGGQLSAVSDLGWDDSTALPGPPSFGQTSSILAVDLFQPGLGVDKISQLSLAPPCKNGGACTSSSSTPSHVTGSSNVSTFDTLQSSELTSKDIGITGGDNTNDTAHLSLVTQTIFESPVPEPMSFLLVGGALVCGGLLGKKLRR